MAVGLTEELGGAPIPGPVVTTSVPRRGRRVQLPRSPKFLVGLGLMVFFLFIAVFGPTLAPQNPSASAPTTGSLPPSGPPIPAPDRRHHGFPSASPFRRALAGHHPAAAVRFLPASGGLAEHGP